MVKKTADIQEEQDPIIHTWYAVIDHYYLLHAQSADAARFGGRNH
jgi:hypothetical protein